MNEKDIGKKFVATRSLLCVSSLGGLLFSSCTPVDVEPEKPSLTETLPIPTEDISIEETDIPTPTLVENIPTETEIIPTETESPVKIVDIPYVSIEKNEAFDMQAVNLFEWEDFTLENDIVLDISESVTTAGEENHLYLLPTVMILGKSTTTIKKLTIPSGYTFNIKEKKVLSNTEGESVTLGILENTFENNSLNGTFALLLNGKDKEKNIQGFVEKEADRIPSVTFMNSGLGYPDNVLPELSALSRVSQYQMDINGFQSGRQFFMKEMLSPMETFPYDSMNFKYFRGTDNLASSLKLLSQKEPELLSLESSMPFLGFVRPGILTVKDINWMSAVGKEEDEDFVFSFINTNNQKYFIKIEPIFANLQNIKDIILKDSETKIIHGATISLVPYSEGEEEEIREQMKKQIKELQSLYSNYELYRQINKGKNHYGEENQLIPMQIPREAFVEKCFLADNFTSHLIGDDKPIPFIPEEEMDYWFFKADESLGY